MNSSSVLYRQCAILKDADPNSFSGIYIVCGYTDMRYGIDSLAAIIESKYHLPLFSPGTLFLFCGRRANKIKGLVWERDGFLLLTKRVEEGYFVLPRCSIWIKNWVNVYSKDGVSASAILYSIIETTRANNLRINDYLEYVISELVKHQDDTNRDFLEKLLPWSDIVQE